MIYTPFSYRSWLRLIDRVIVIVFLTWALILATSIVNRKAGEDIDRSLREQIKKVCDLADRAFGTAK